MMDSTCTNDAAPDEFSLEPVPHPLGSVIDSSGIVQARNGVLLIVLFETHGAADGLYQVEKPGGDYVATRTRVGARQSIRIPAVPQVVEMIETRVSPSLSEFMDITYKLGGDRRSYFLGGSLRAVSTDVFANRKETEDPTQGTLRVFRLVKTELMGHLDDLIKLGTQLASDTNPRATSHAA